MSRPEPRSAAGARPFPRRSGSLRTGRNGFRATRSPASLSPPTAFPCRWPTRRSPGCRRNTASTAIWSAGCSMRCSARRASWRSARPRRSRCSSASRSRAWRAAIRQRWADIAALTALVIAAMCVLAWLLRLSSLVNFISETILLGFKAGAALTIAMTQLPKLFGVKGGGQHFFERIVDPRRPAARHQPRRARLRPGRARAAAARRKVPAGPSDRAARGGRFHRRVVGDAAGANSGSTSSAHCRGLARFPACRALRVRDVDGVIPLAFACLLLAYVESVSAARALAQQNGYEIDPRQELLGLGAANLAAGFFQAYPVAGGLSQSSVNDKAGAKTPLALVFASITIGVVPDVPDRAAGQPAQRRPRRHRAGRRQGTGRHRASCGTCGA